MKPILCTGNCKTCSEIEMGQFVEDHGDVGFTKKDVKNAVGDKFCESAWRRFAAKSRRMIGATYSFTSDGKWYYM